MTAECNKRSEFDYKEYPLQLKLKDNGAAESNLIETSHLIARNNLFNTTERY
jgi:hypothetical protein